MKEVRNYRKLKSSLDEMYLWDDDKKIQHIRELHRHIEDLYDEVDSLYGKIEKLVQVNQELVTEILGLKAQLYDLLR